MAPVAWIEDYSVKVRRFDEQHRKLIEIVNRLDGSMRENEEPGRRADALTALAACVQVHFSDEERVMRVHFFPGFVPHKKAHDRMAEQVRVFQRQARADGKAITPGVVCFLRDWLIEHILVEDARYGTFMNSRGVA